MLNFHMVLDAHPNDGTEGTYSIVFNLHFTGISMPLWPYRTHLQLIGFLWHLHLMVWNVFSFCCNLEAFDIVRFIWHLGGKCSATDVAHFFVRFILSLSVSGISFLSFSGGTDWAVLSSNNAVQCQIYQVSNQVYISFLLIYFLTTAYLIFINFRMFDSYGLELGIVWLS